MQGISEELFVAELFSALSRDKLVLPSLPEIAVKVSEVIADADSSYHDIAEVILKDPAISARILQVANSPLLGGGTQIKTVENAIMRMGQGMLKNLVNCLAMKQLYVSSSPVVNRKLQESWQHSSEVAALASLYASPYKYLQKDLAMLAGMVHNIGVLPILTMAENYPEVLEDEVMLDSILERSKASAGTALVDFWKFPSELVDVTMNYQNLQYDSGDKVDYVELIIAANLTSSLNTHIFANLDSTQDIPALRKLQIVECVEYMDYLEAGCF